MGCDSKCGFAAPQSLPIVPSSTLLPTPARVAFGAAVGKTVVSSQYDRSRRHKVEKQKLYEVPVGFKCSSKVCSTARLASAAKESAGHPCPVGRQLWTTDKDGIVPALLAAETHRADGPRSG